MGENLMLSKLTKQLISGGTIDISDIIASDIDINKLKSGKIDVSKLPTCDLGFPINNISGTEYQ